MKVELSDLLLGNVTFVIELTVFWVNWYNNLHLFIFISSTKICFYFISLVRFIGFCRLAGLPIYIEKTETAFSKIVPPPAALYKIPLSKIGLLFETRVRPLVRVCWPAFPLCVIVSLFHKLDSAFLFFFTNHQECHRLFQLYAVKPKSQPQIKSLMTCCHHYLFNPLGWKERKKDERKKADSDVLFIRRSKFGPQYSLSGNPLFKVLMRLEFYFADHFSSTCTWLKWQQSSWKLSWRQRD